MVYVKERLSVLVLGCIDGCRRRHSKEREKSEMSIEGSRGGEGATGIGERY